MSKYEDIEMKFEGEIVKNLKGAPAYIVISSLNALVRMVHIIGMRAEGHTLAQRVKPSAKVRREYSVVCRATTQGSYIQDFNLESQTGKYSAKAVAAREKLLATLRAFDSGDDEELCQILPNARERWFLADAAAGLVPPDEEDIYVALRPGKRGRFSFRSDRARRLIEKYSSGPPPEAQAEEVVGKIHSIDFSNTTLKIKPQTGPAIKMEYPLKIEEWIKNNVRRKMLVYGDVDLSKAGAAVRFARVYSITEIEASLAPISNFRSNDMNIVANRPLRVPLKFDFESRMFCFENESLGISAFAEHLEDIRSEILDELDVNWRNFALAADNELSGGAQRVRKNLLKLFAGDSDVT